MEQHLHELVGLAAPTTERPVPGPPRNRLADPRLRAILGEIEKNFSERGFNELVLSQKYGISVRYIQKLLKTTGTSFTQYITRLRLEAVRAGLVDPRHDQRTIAELAFGAGFRDVSHFNRLFRSHFGETPTLVRGKRSSVQA